MYQQLRIRLSAKSGKSLVPHMECLTGSIERHRLEVCRFLSGRVGCAETAADIFQSIAENLLRRNPDPPIEDVRAFLDASREMGIPVYVERSRSGKGAHVWVFFDEPVPAIAARKLGSTILTAAMEKRHQVGLDSYDRLFPNQDTLPKGGFGNLIALPLQRGPREQSNSVFLDENLDPLADQWSFLA